MAMGSFLPIVMLCGIIWPIEGMYPGLKFFALFVSISEFLRIDQFKYFHFNFSYLLPSQLNAYDRLLREDGRSVSQLSMEDSYQLVFGCWYF